MGSPEDEEGREPEEGPVHDVTLTPFLPYPGKKLAPGPHPLWVRPGDSSVRAVGDTARERTMAAVDRAIAVFVHLDVELGSARSFSLEPNAALQLDTELVGGRLLERGRSALRARR